MMMSQLSLEENPVSVSTFSCALFFLRWRKSVIAGKAMRQNIKIERDMRDRGMPIFEKINMPKLTRERLATKEKSTYSKEVSCSNRFEHAESISAPGTKKATTMVIRNRSCWNKMSM